MTQITQIHANDIYFKIKINFFICENLRFLRHLRSLHHLRSFLTK